MARRHARIERIWGTGTLYGPSGGNMFPERMDAVKTDVVAVYSEYDRLAVK